MKFRSKDLVIIQGLGSPLCDGKEAIVLNPSGVWNDCYIVRLKDGTHSIIHKDNLTWTAAIMRFKVGDRVIYPWAPWSQPCGEVTAIHGNSITVRLDDGVICSAQDPTLWDFESMPSMPKLEDPNDLSHICTYAPYIGVIHTYEYCTGCDKKRPYNPYKK